MAKQYQYLCLGEMTAIVGEMTIIFFGCGGNANLGVGEPTTSEKVWGNRHGRNEDFIFRGIDAVPHLMGQKPPHHPLSLTQPRIKDWFNHFGVFNLCTHNSNNYNFGEQKSAAERRGHEKTRKP